METPCIITVAITGSVPTQADNPAVPVTPEQQVQSTKEAYEAGASLVHVHVRNDDGTMSADPTRFKEVMDGIRESCPDMIVQFSTGGRSASGDARGGMLHYRPDMASLATGSVNFPTSIYENSPALIDDLAGRMLRYDVKPEIEVFDLAMLFNAARYLKEGKLKGPLHVQFVLGIRNALPARRDLLEYLVGVREELLPDSTWVAAGLGRHQREVSQWCAELGGHVRTGLEDNIRIDRSTLAPSNAALVELAAQDIRAAGRRVATPSEARELLGLPAAAVAA